MQTRLDHFDLHFALGEYDFHISNIVLERFERSIPATVTAETVMKSIISLLAGEMP